MVARGVDGDNGNQLALRSLIVINSPVIRRFFFWKAK